MKILVTATSMTPDKPSAALEALKAFSDEIVFNPKKKPLSEDELIPLLQDCDGYIAGLDQVTEKVLKACPKLKVVSRYGVGCDAVDIRAARELGIAVTNTPAMNAEGVAELAMGLILSAARQIPYLDFETKKGNWIRSTGIELYGRTIGIIGLGAIGKRLARIAKGFCMRVAAYDPFIDRAYCLENGIEICGLDEVIANSDIISLHLPLNNETHHMINAERISRMKDGVIIVNASRGGILDEDAVYDGLMAGKIGGLGLDAFEIEPPKGIKLMTLNTVVATPHAGAHTYESVRNMQDLSVKNLIDVLKGNDCPYIVN